MSLVIRAATIAFCVRVSPVLREKRATKTDRRKVGVCHRRLSTGARLCTGFALALHWLCTAFSSPLHRSGTAAAVKPTQKIFLPHSFQI
jgi:hypothetical protein